MLGYVVDAACLDPSLEYALVLEDKQKRISISFDDSYFSTVTRIDNSVTVSVLGSSKKHIIALQPVL